MLQKLTRQLFSSRVYGGPCLRFSTTVSNNKAGKHAGENDDASLCLNCNTSYLIALTCWLHCTWQSVHACVSGGLNFRVGGLGRRPPPFWNACLLVFLLAWLEGTLSIPLGRIKSSFHRAGHWPKAVSSDYTVVRINRFTGLQPYAVSPLSSRNAFSGVCAPQYGAFLGRT